MPGRFREGTETCIRKVRTLETLPTCRQTQNPERGRKLEIQHHIRSCGMLPKSSDPKPREGTETRGTVPPGPAPSGSSDPKPREGTETRKRSTSLTILFSRRQTQNPERGRKLNNTFFERGAVESVVRPKTPRGDGNTETQHQPDNLILASSDPKPREGTETFGKSVRSKRFQRVVRPKTPRGDGNAPWMADALCAQVSSDPKPREGTET
ncbi:Uncharacterised protein [Mycobacterium tuberculosis]|nr:Uncharacterised protein [Mycobacterium tuberculosis]